MVAPIAVLDIGSNTVRLLLDRSTPGEHPAGPRIARIVGLRRGAGRDGTLAGDALDRLRDCFDEFGEHIRESGALRGIALGTSAIRDAPNREAAATLLASRAGLPLTVLSGEAEAVLSFLGAGVGGGEPGPRLVLDVGGASTELVLGEGSRVRGAVSLQLGAVRCTEAMLGSDPPSQQERRALRDHVRDAVGEAITRIGGVAPIVAVAGTATTLAAIDLGGYDPVRVHGHRLSVDRIREIADRLAAMTCAERERVAGLEPKRAPVIVAGTEIVLAVLDVACADHLTVSERDILDGAALKAERLATGIDRRMSPRVIEVGDV